MKTISTSPFFYKRIFPVMFAIPIGLFVFISFLGGPHAPPPFIFVVPLAAWVIMMFIWNKVWKALADEVSDAGSALVVSMRGQEFTVPLANIINVSASVMGNPPMITLRLRQPGPFGRDISFLIRQRRTMRTWVQNPYVNELIDRVDAARQRHDSGHP